MQPEERDALFLKRHDPQEPWKRYACMTVQLSSPAGATGISPVA